MRDASGSHGESRSHTHLCHVFDDPADLRARAVEFLADGVTRGLRVRYVADDEPDALRAELAPLDRLPEARLPGAVEVQSLAHTYSDPTVLVDADAQVAVYAAATRAALADGFTGFRVAADVTELVRTAEQLDAFARYEHRADRLMASSAFSALCGYHRAALGDQVVTQVACLHPADSVGCAPFRVHATRSAHVAISGELDLTTVGLFTTTMDRVGLHDAPAEVVVDATRLAFADHRNLLVLEQLARRYGRSIVLRTSRRWPERLVTALQLTRVRVERATSGTALI